MVRLGKKAVEAVDLNENAVKLLNKFTEVRLSTANILEKIGPEDSCVQSMPDASPAKWHAAHTTWFFETFILKKFKKNYVPFNNDYQTLFNSYYNSVGSQFSRDKRGMITRPSLSEILNYRLAIDAKMKSLIHIHYNNCKFKKLIELGLNHEQQHQELLLMDLKNLFSMNPINIQFSNGQKLKSEHVPQQWHKIEKGLYRFGMSDDQFCFDNETPQHDQIIDSFSISSKLVTNSEYLEFIQDGAYQDPLLWLSDGWSWIKETGVTAPLYWRNADNSWFEFTLYGCSTVDPDDPVCHVNFYEASAFAAWKKKRLPTEYEWELSMRKHGKKENQRFSYHPSQTLEPTQKLHSMFGGVWQWTNSSYLPFPRFKTPKGAVGEYNGKFMSNQMVLKGGACCTPIGHERISYRNFFYPHQRWAFSGIRLAEDH